MIKLSNPIIIHCNDNCTQLRTVIVFFIPGFWVPYEYPRIKLDRHYSVVQIIESEPRHQHLDYNLD